MLLKPGLRLSFSSFCPNGVRGFNRNNFFGRSIGQNQTDGIITGRESLRKFRVDSENIAVSSPTFVITLRRVGSVCFRSSHALGSGTENAEMMLFLLALPAWVARLCPAQNPSPILKDKGWKLVWRDEFNGPDGSAVDRSKWVVETGGEGWGNEELEYYAKRQSRHPP